MARQAGLSLSLNNYTAFKQNLKVLDDVIAGLDKSIDTAGKSFDKLDAKIGVTEPSAAKLGKTFKDTTNVIKTGTNDIDAGISSLTRTAQNLESIGTKVALGISAPAAAIKAFAVSSAISFETAFGGVEKTLDTTNLTAEETTIVLAEIRQGIRDLATDVNSPLAGLENAHNELARIAELGSQLGVARDSVLEFTETIGLLAMTSDMTADVGATSIAQFANIMQSTEFSRIGSTIVDLGNKSAATETQIIEFGQRLAAAGAQANFSEADVLGFGAAMASVGLNAEAGGTAMTRVINDMVVATAQGGESLQTFAEVAGMSGEEFTHFFEEDAAGAIATFIAGLGELESAEVIDVLDQLGLSDVRVSDTLRRLSQAPELLAGSLDIANQAFADNTAMQEEAAKRFETTAAQINLLKNNIRDLAISIGDALLPGINHTIDMMVTFIQMFQDASPAAFRLVAAFLGIAAAAGPVILFAAQLVKAFEILSITFTLPAWWIIAGAIAAIGVVVYDLKNNVGGAADALAALGSNLGTFFTTLQEIGTAIVGVFQFIIDLMPHAERSFSPVAAALNLINTYITNMTSGLARVRDFLTLFNAATGNTPVAQSTEGDTERNRLLEERKRLLEDINRLEEEGLATQTESLTVQVESGDTLWDIARANNTTVEELMRLNNLDSSLITVGQELVISEGSAAASAEVQNLRNQLSDVDEMLRHMPTGVQSAFDAFAETPLFERIFGTDEGARDRALTALAGISAEAAEIRTAVGGIASGFGQLFTGDFDAGIESIRSGFSSIVDSIREMFNIFGEARPQPFMLAGDEGMFADVGTESGGNLFAGLGERIKSGMEEIANGDYSSVETLLGDNLGAVLTGAVSVLANMVLPGSGIFVGLAAKMVGAMEMDFNDIETLFQNSTILQSIQEGLSSLFGGGEQPFMLAGDEEMFGVTSSNTSAGGIFAPLIDGISNGVDAFMTTIEPITSAITLVWDSSLKPAIDTLIEGIGGFAEQFNDSLDQDAMEEGESILQTFIDFLVEDLATNIKFFGSIIGAITSGIGKALPDLGGALAELINIVTDVLSGDFESAAGSISGFLSKIVSAIGNFVVGTADNIIGFLEDLTGMDFASAEDVVGWITDLGNLSLSDGINSLINFFEDVTGGDFTAGRDFVEQITNFLNLTPGQALTAFMDLITNPQTWENIGNVIGNIFRSIGLEIQIQLDTLGLKFAAIQAMIPGGDEADTQNILAATESIQQGRVLQGAFGAIGPEGVNLDVPISFEIEGQQFNDSLRNWLGQPGIIDAASADWQTFIEQALTSAAENADATTFYAILGTAMQNGFTGETIDVAGLTDTLLANIDATTIEEETTAIGENIVTGLTTGLEENESLGVDGAVNFSDAVMTSMEEQFGVQSPSTWMQDVGLHLIEGLQLGLIDNLPLLEVAFMLLKEQFAPIVTALNTMFDSVIAKEQAMIEMMKIAGQVWGLELKGMDKGINKIGASIGGLIPKIEQFISLMGKIPAIAIINLQGTAPGTPPPNQAVATVHAQGGPGFAGMIAKVAEPEIGGIEIIRQDGGGTYIVSGKDFMAVPPTAMPMSAPVGSLPMPPAALGGATFGGSSIIFEQPVIIENPSGGPVTPETIATGMQQWQRQNPPRRQMRDSL